MMKFVRLITTGGTIATTTKANRTAARLSANELIHRTVTDHDVDATVKIEEILQVPSWSLDARAMSQIAMTVRAAAREPEVSGVVMTHGTTTMEYSAYLADLFVDTDVPVVFTGAMRNADAPDADGPRNLADALRVAIHDGSRSIGVVVCFAGKVFGARDVRKNHREALDAFTGGSLGTIGESGFNLVNQPRRPRIFKEPIEPNVGMVKAFPGCGRDQIDLLVAGGSRGIVVEGLPGSGGIPPEMQPGLRDAAQKGLPVVVASRAPLGRVPSPPTGGTEAPLQDMDLISAGDLTTEKAWVLLMAVLGETSDRQALRKIWHEVAG